jgi:DNA polymerase III subunit beta
MTLQENAKISIQDAERSTTSAVSSSQAPCPVQPKDGTKFVLEREALLRSLELVMKTIPTRRGYPDILFHVQVQVESDHIILSGTNLVTGIVLQVPAQVEQTGTFTINARLLLDCVKTFPKAGAVSICVTSGKVVVASGKRVFTLKDATDGHDFPHIPDVVMENPCCIAADVLRQAVKEVQFAAGDMDGRVVYMAICMHVKEDEMSLVAFDNKRMAMRTLALSYAPVRNEMVLVEAASWRLLCDVVPKDGEITIAWDKEGAAFTCGHLRLVTRLIEGTYPDYTDALPKSHKTTFTLSRSALVSLLNAFRPFTRDSSNILKIFYAPSGSVTFKASSDDLGEVSDELAVEVIGEGGEVFLNAEYVADVLKYVPEESFRFSLSGYGKPCLMTPVGRNDYKAVVMPMGK